MDSASGDPELRFETPNEHLIFRCNAESSSSSLCVHGSWRGFMLYIDHIITFFSFYLNGYIHRRKRPSTQNGTNSQKNKSTLPRITLQIMGHNVKVYYLCWWISGAEKMQWVKSWENKFSRSMHVMWKRPQCHEDYPASVSLYPPSTRQLSFIYYRNDSLNLSHIVVIWLSLRLRYIDRQFFCCERI